LAKAKTAAPEAPQITFYVQVGAFRTPDDAERHRAKLALKGVDAKITERELSGRPVYRARVGPFEKLEDAETAKDKMDKLGIETALVKVQR
jgi:cell division protein FtsN